MTGVDPQPISADSLRRRAEWQAVFPESRMLWEETADEGTGIGFDGLDPSAMMRALYATTSPWAEVLAWYRSILEPLGWPVPQEQLSHLGFEVLFTARGPFSAAMGSPDA